MKLTYIFCVLFFFSIPKTCTTPHDTLGTLIKALIALNWFGAISAVALDLSNAFDRIKYTGCLQKLNSYGTSGQIVGLLFFFLSHNNRWLQVFLNGKS